MVSGCRFNQVLVLLGLPFQGSRLLPWSAVSMGPWHVQGGPWQCAGGEGRGTPVSVVAFAGGEPASWGGGPCPGNGWSELPLSEAKAVAHGTVWLAGGLHVDVNAMRSCS
jgi:hypothetical protein